MTNPHDPRRPIAEEDIEDFLQRRAARTHTPDPDAMAHSRAALLAYFDAHAHPLSPRTSSAPVRWPWRLRPLWIASASAAIVLVAVLIGRDTISDRVAQLSGDRGSMAFLAPEPDDASVVSRVHVPTPATVMDSATREAKSVVKGERRPEASPEVAEGGRRPEASPEVAEGGRRPEASPEVAEAMTPTSAPTPSSEAALAKPIERTTHVESSASAWQRVADMPEPRVDYAAAPLPDGRVLLAGGTSFLWQNPAPVYTGVLYEPRSGTWSVTGSPYVARIRPAMTNLASGSVLMAGGNVPGENSSEAVASSELYDPTTGTWRLTGHLNNARANPTLTLLPDGRVLAVGGASSSPDGERPLNTAELFDPLSETWHLVQDRLAVPREGHFAVNLPSGRVLIGGGDGPRPGSGVVTELFDPATDTFEATAVMNHARHSPSATLLPDGRVLVVGGFSLNSLDSALTYLSSAEIYDPVQGVWELVAPAAIPRAQHVAIPLPDGRVAIAGGQNANGILASTELYDPATDTWSRLEVMPVGVIPNMSAPVPLPGGTYLIAGGVAEAPDLSNTVASAAAQVLTPSDR